MSLTILIPLLLITYATTAIIENRLVVRLSTTLLGLQLVFLIAFNIANWLGRDGFNNTVIAHLKYLLDWGTLIRFWPIAILTLAALLFSLLGLAFLERRIIKTSINTSSVFRTFITLIAPSTLLILLALNPLTQDLAAIAKTRSLERQYQISEHETKLQIIAPPIGSISPEKKFDFVIIFAESLEATFFDEKWFPGLMSSTNRLIQDRGLRHQGIKDLTLSNWTDSGLTAATCGLSMTVDFTEASKTKLSAQKIAARKASSTLRGETCIGDILHSDGYQLAFIGGSEFGWESKERLFRQQGFDRFFGEKEIQSQQQSPKPTTTWGVYDDTLFDTTLNIIKQRNQRSPQGLVVLTVDTHTPGYPSPKCVNLTYLDLGDKLLDAAHCADHLISGLISEIIQAESTKDTVIFLISDHLYPGELKSEGKSIPRQQRENMFAVFNSRLPLDKQQLIPPRIATSLDVAPTILAHLGYDIKTLNFGRNISEIAPTLAETYGLQKLSLNIVNLRNKLRAYWKQELLNAETD
ncbi:sulfatase-like hydrolase/transferase [Arenicella xantha]|uniref:Phosphoglycerol transferase n=1 Tax=Arenicella xantha TaxID=644221 RepID=A0A395JN47_9GAMM|nr:sulfatase-like hydrolase/transferase [Arenicella xantha]RBP53094.1 phosphoglycerol transferase [Arenicella xantha]